MSRCRAGRSALLWACSSIRLNLNQPSRVCAVSGVDQNQEINEPHHPEALIFICKLVTEEVIKHSRSLGPKLEKLKKKYLLSEIASNNAQGCQESSHLPNKIETTVRKTKSYPSVDLVPEQRTLCPCTVQLALPFLLTVLWTPVGQRPSPHGKEDSYRTLEMAMHTYNPCTHQVEAGRSGGQGQLQIHKQLKVTWSTSYLVWKKLNQTERHYEKQKIRG